MQARVDAVRSLIALAGVTTFLIQPNPASANSKDSELLELLKFEQIGPDHIDYKFKIAVCDVYGLSMALATKLRDKSGDPQKSIFGTNEYYRETFRPGIRKVVGLDLSKSYDDPRMQPLAGKMLLAGLKSGLYRAEAWRICKSVLNEAVEKAVNTNRPISNASSSSSDAHEDCLEARDYEGCVRVKTGNSDDSDSNNCEPFKWCIAGRGKDMFGMPTIPGWKMISDPTEQTVTYMAPVFKKVNVRGNTDRYMVHEMIVRRYSSPKAGSPGSTTSIGSATTDCTGYGSSISCTTTPATTISIPGTSATPGGVSQTSLHYLVDCKDKTRGTHVNGKLAGKWESIEGTVDEENSNNFCPIIERLELSTFDTYSK